MATELHDMDLDERDKRVLRLLEHGRVNPMYIREHTELDKGDVNTVLNRLGRLGYVRQVTRGLYEITPDGREAINAGPLAEVGYLEETEIIDAAEDVKTVRFTGARGSVDVDITDESMHLLAETTEEVYNRIHKHMDELRELFEQDPDERSDDE